MALWRHALLLTALTASLSAWAADAGPVQHRFICADNGRGFVCLVGTDGAIAWEYPADFPQDVWQMPGGDILFSHRRGAKRVTPDKRVVWEYRSPDNTEVHTCQPLADGGVMLAEGGTQRIIEIGVDGTIGREFKVEMATTNTHLQFRYARKLADGHYLAALVGDHKAVELDGDGKLLRTIPTPGDVFCAVRLADGNTLLGCGDGHRVIEVDRDGKVVWELGENELPGIALRFVGGVQRLPNGNTVVCNWGGHGHVGQQPHIFEVTPDKHVVWQLADYEHFKTISGVEILDLGAPPVR